MPLSFPAFRTSPVVSSILLEGSMDKPTMLPGIIKTLSFCSLVKCPENSAFVYFLKGMRSVYATREELDPGNRHKENMTYAAEFALVPYQDLEHQYEL